MHVHVRVFRFFLKVGRPDLLIKRFLHKTRYYCQELFQLEIVSGIFFLTDGKIFCVVYTFLFVLSF